MKSARELIKETWENVQENSRRLRGCPRHRFKGERSTMLKANYVCSECGGEIDSLKINYYIQGYMAAGGDVNDIWPGYFDKKVDKNE